MHENREISSTPWSDDQGRSVKATSRTTDMYVLEKSDCAVIPVNQPNKEGKPSAEVGEERVQLEENIVRAHMLLTLSRNMHDTAFGRCARCNPQSEFAFTPFILQKSRMRRRARTDLCGGRPVKAVPTATRISTLTSCNADYGFLFRRL